MLDLITHLNGIACNTNGSRIQVLQHLIININIHNFPINLNHIIRSIIIRTTKLIQIMGIEQIPLTLVIQIMDKERIPQTKTI